MFLCVSSRPLLSCDYVIAIKGSHACLGNCDPNFGTYCLDHWLKPTELSNFQGFVNCEAVKWSHGISGLACCSRGRRRLVCSNATYQRWKSRWAFPHCLGFRQTQLRWMPLPSPIDAETCAQMPASLRQTILFVGLQDFWTSKARSNVHRVYCNEKQTWMQELLQHGYQSPSSEMFCMWHSLLFQVLPNFCLGSP